jgi:uncharacterized RDD family membrane protein YckC
MIEPADLSVLKQDSHIYLLVINGKPEGPFTLQELKARKVKPGDFVRTDGMDDYKEAHEIAALRELFGFSKPVVMPQYFAGFDQRLLASALDWFFVAGVCVIIAFMASLFIGDKDTRLYIALGLLLVIPVVKIIYHMVMECTAKQGTYGKQLLKIKVSDMQGNRISFVRSVNRNVLKIVSVLPFFIGYIFSFFNKQQQCMHDMLAGTLVIKDRLL